MALLEVRDSSRHIGGLAAFDAGRLDDAGALWNSALAHAERFAGDDPRRATALNNIAAVRHLRGGAAEADGFYRAALDAWAAAEPWIEATAAAPRARASPVHRRLETKHWADDHRIARGAPRKLLDAGRGTRVARRETGTGALDGAGAAWAVRRTQAGGGAPFGAPGRPNRPGRAMAERPADGSEPGEFFVAD